MMLAGLSFLLDGDRGDDGPGELGAGRRDLPLNVSSMRVSQTLKKGIEYRGTETCMAEHT